MEFLCIWEEKPINPKNYTIGFDPASEKLPLPKDFVVLKSINVNGEKYIQSFKAGDQESMEKMVKSIIDKF